MPEPRQAFDELERRISERPYHEGRLADLREAYPPDLHAGRGLWYNDTMTATHTHTGLDFVQAIASGELDGKLELVNQALRARQLYLRSIRAAENRRDLTPGTRVITTKGLSPKYLVGLTGVVSDRPARNPEHIRVDLDSGQSTRRYLPEFPAQCLDAIDGPQ